MSFSKHHVCRCGHISDYSLIVCEKCGREPSLYSNSRPGIIADYDYQTKTYTLPNGDVLDRDGLVAMAYPPQKPRRKGFNWKFWRTKK